MDRGRQVSGGPDPVPIPLMADSTDTTVEKVLDSPLIGRALFERSPFRGVLYDSEGHPLMVNAAFEQMWGVGLDSVPPGYTVLQDPQLEQQGALATIRRAFEGEAVITPPVRYDIASVATSGAGRTLWTQGHFWPITDASGRVIFVVLNHVDLTARMEAEISLRERTTLYEQQSQEANALNTELTRANEELRAALDELARARDVSERDRSRLRLVAEAGALLSASLDPEGTVQRVAQLVVPHFADWCAVDVLDADGSITPIAVVHADPGKLAIARELRTRYPPPPDSPTGTPAVIRTGKSELHENISDDLVVASAQDEFHLQMLRQLQMRSVLIVPLMARGRRLGALTLMTTAESGRNFDHGDLTTAEELAWRAALALDNSRLYRLQAAATERMSRLQRATAALARAVTASEVADAVLTEGVQLLSADEGIVCIRSDDGEWLEIVAQTGLPDDLVEPYKRMPLDAPLPLSDAVRTGESIFLEDREAMVARYPSLRERDSRAVSEAWAALPLRIGDTNVGGLAFGFNTKRRFETEERAFLDALTLQCAQALERSRLIEAERAARAEAESANRTKMEFLATMSHELRTPLNAIGGYADLLEMGLRGPLNPAQRQDIERLRRSQQSLVALVEDVLSFAKIEAGTIEFVFDNVLLSEALGSLEALVAPQFQQRSIRYHCSPVDPSLTVRADREKLEQIVLNLLSNAVKFTEEGQVTLSVEGLDDEVIVSVSDTGIGIEADKLDLIFEPFVQVHSGYTRRAPGTGLGLAISRDLARRMDGDLTVTSEPGVGSRFSLRLPRGDAI
jgi:PAS domain S-box-containing protein